MKFIFTKEQLQIIYDEKEDWLSKGCIIYIRGKNKKIKNLYYYIVEIL